MAPGHAGPLCSFPEHGGKWHAYCNGWSAAGNPRSAELPAWQTPLPQKQSKGVARC